MPGLPGPSRLDKIDTRLLEPVVRKALDDPDVTVEDWSAEPVKGDGSSDQRFVCRISGEASAAWGRRPWAVYLKVPNSTASARSPWHRETFQREVRLHETRILEEARPAMAAPRCLGIDYPEGDQPWLWLEAVDGVPSLAWPLERFPVAARHLGRMQGALLGGKGLPDLDWLHTGQWLRPREEEGAAGVPSLMEAFAAHPLTAPLWRSAFGERLRLVYESRGRFVDAMERLPNSLCHGDFSYTNIFSPREKPDAFTIAIDWQYAGLGPLGQDISGLIADCSVMPVRRKAAEPEVFTAMMLDAWLDGLVEGDPGTDVQVARFACHAFLSIPWTFHMLMGLNGSLFRKDWGGDAEARCTDYVRVQTFLFDVWDAAHTELGAI